MLWEYKFIARVAVPKIDIRERGTKSTLNGVDLPCPDSLAIVKLGEDEGYYLLEILEGVEMTDTYHDTIDEAMRQAEFDLKIKPEDWVFQ